jgi:hypothetical protein
MDALDWLDANAPLPFLQGPWYIVWPASIGRFRGELASIVARYGGSLSTGAIEAIESIRNDRLVNILGTLQQLGHLHGTAAARVEFAGNLRRLLSVLKANGYQLSPPSFYTSEGTVPAFGAMRLKELPEAIRLQSINITAPG